MPDPVVLHTVHSSIREGLAETLPGEHDVRIANSTEESRTLLADAEIAIAGRLPAELLEVAPELEWVQAMSAGVDYLPLEELEQRNIALTNASGVHAEPIGEQVLGFMLAFERGLQEAMRQQHRGVWERIGGGGELAGKTVGIVGVGAIGSRVAELATAFQMTVLGTKRDPDQPPDGADAVDELYGPDGLGELLDRADYLVIACPLNEETRELIGSDELRRLDDEAVIVNIARGEIIDQDALVTALQNHSIGGAGLDVFEEEPLPAGSPLWELSNVMLTPHTSGSTPKYSERFASILADNLDAYQADGLAGLDNRVL